MSGTDSSSLLSASNIDTSLITSLDEDTSSVRSGVAVFFGALAGVYIIIIGKKIMISMAVAIIIMALVPTLVFAGG